jgi:hypothetical protein
VIRLRKNDRGLALGAGALSLLALLTATGCIVDSELSGKACNSTKHPCLDGWTCVEGACIPDAEAQGLQENGGETQDAGPTLTDSGTPDGEDSGILPQTDSGNPPQTDSGTPPVGDDGGSQPGSDASTPPESDGGPTPGDDGGPVPGDDGGPPPAGDAGPPFLDLQLAANPLHALAVRLTFDASGQTPNSLRLFRRLQSDAAFVELATLAGDATDHTDGDNVVPEARYVYRLEALDGADAALAYDEVTVVLPKIEAITNGLVLAYDLDDGTGGVVADTSGVTPALDLGIENQANTSWLGNGGGLSFDTERCAASVDADATKLYSGITNSGQMTVEAWINPADLVQAGPARMVSYSLNTSERNFTLGQEADALVFRLRTPDSGINGSQPAYSSAGALALEWQHVAATFDGATSRGYVNGVARPETLDLPGGITGWDSTHRVVLANEVDPGARQWLGQMHRVRIYDRPLSDLELTVNMHARFTVPGVVVIDADLDQPIAGLDPIPDGTEINLATLPSRNITFDAMVAPDQVDSVEFYYDGAFERLENSPPYVMNDESGGDYQGFTPTVGTHTLRVVPYRLPDGNGIPGTSHTITFTVIDQ